MKTILYNKGIMKIQNYLQGEIFEIFINEEGEGKNFSFLDISFLDNDLFSIINYSEPNSITENKREVFSLYKPNEAISYTDLGNINIKNKIIS